MNGRQTNSERWIDELARRARQEQPPPFDVTGLVLARIRGSRPQSYDPMAIMAGSSAAAAAIVLAYALQTWLALQDPISSMLASMNLVLQ
jgi:hypothetical protein